MSESVRFHEAPPIDHELTAEIVREVVREQFPELAVATTERLGDGWEHETYLVDDRVVFRFPRQAGGGDDFEWEEGIHALVASLIGDMVGIPRITRWGRPAARFPYPFAGHDLIPGVAANDSLAPLNPALADNIGRVLARLHAISPEAASAVGASTADAQKSDLVAGLERVRFVVNELPEIRRLFPNPCAWLDSIQRAPDAYSGPPRFIHDDFQAEHILVSRATGRLSGIIDWGGGLGDPMRDFSYVLLLGGWSFFQRAIDAYVTLRADSAQYTVHTNGPLLWASIGFHAANKSGRALSMNYCNTPTPPLLEKQRADGSWMLAYSPVLQLCQTLPPFRLENGGAYEGTLKFAAGRPGTKVSPMFEPDSVPGIYRLRWGLRAGADPDNRAAPIVTILSPSFRLTTP